ncbi:hypothetical protein [Gemelliphila palaticanis]|uniref:DUF3139 domain-containing protein n=1 Tax=Gemelliphila palaticanis TaxID=81950 RepID=A0ABX2SX69_9BACL|nr:hypothetical protein [Gemella palaticanis]MBF0714872.1 hypothetical protein [Gemella palaticanis]NYS46802.1 hypothetical protein [Gemella palaticanis]
MGKYKKITLLIALGLATYPAYRKINKLYKEDNYIKDCKKQILDRGYEIKDSWCLSLPENNYLEFTFTDYKNKNYTVIYSKLENKITSIKEV